MLLSSRVCPIHAVARCITSSLVGFPFGRVSLFIPVLPESNVRPGAVPGSTDFVYKPHIIHSSSAACDCVNVLLSQRQGKNESMYAIVVSELQALQLFRRAILHSLVRGSLHSAHPVTLRPLVHSAGQKQSRQQHLLTCCQLRLCSEPLSINLEVHELFQLTHKLDTHPQTGANRKTAGLLGLEQPFSTCGS